MSSYSNTATFWEHLAELRQTIIHILFIILIGFIFCFFFYKEIYSYILLPIHQKNTSLLTEDITYRRISNLSSKAMLYKISSDSFIELKPKETRLVEISNTQKNLVILSPTDGFKTTLKLSLFIGVFITSPFWLYSVLRFISPAFASNTKKPFLFFIFLSFLFGSLGIIFSYFLTLPITTLFFESFNEEIGFNLWTLEGCLDYTLGMLFSHALAFELAVVFLFLIHFGILSAQTMISKRRHAIVLILIIAAILTPPDIMSQLMLAIPMMILYELLIFYGIFRQKKLALQLEIT